MNESIQNLNKRIETILKKKDLQSLLKEKEILEKKFTSKNFWKEKK